MFQCLGNECNRHLLQRTTFGRFVGFFQWRCGMMPRLYLSGIRVNFTAQRIVAPVNRNLNSSQSVSDHHDRTPRSAVFPSPFHKQGIAHDQADNRQENESVFRF